MFGPRDHYHNLSLRLSQVLDEIGVNQELVMKRRRGRELMEEVLYIGEKIDKNCKNRTYYYFGSQSEGSTTVGLNSDIDTLGCYHGIRLIQDWSEWEQGYNKTQLMMVQDETTSPGYCLLPVVDSRQPRLFNWKYFRFQNEMVSTDKRGRVLVKHSVILYNSHNGTLIHGPAYVRHGSVDNDLVESLHCLSWPKEADPWLHQQNDSGWPTEDMKRHSAQQGCFVVPVDSKTGMYTGLEWRISTSFAERYLTWSVNITQMRCYILMKMIIKTFLKPVCEETVSSFMCKNILFRCIANSGANSEWNEESLVSWLHQCLTDLLHCILEENCPHFIIPGNNLLRGKLTAEFEHKLEGVLCSLARDMEKALLGIEIDDLGFRLREKSGVMPSVSLRSAYKIAGEVAFDINSNHLQMELSQVIKDMRKEILVHDNAFSAYQMLKKKISKLFQSLVTGNKMENVAISLICPFFFTSAGCIKASEDFQHSRVISQEALKWFSMGMNSDVASSKLKLASALYYAENIKGCEVILFDLKRQVLSQAAVVTMCSCIGNSNIFPYSIAEDFAELCYERNEDVIKRNIAFCVTFLPYEVNCIPLELKYEMFRSTREDRQNRGKGDDWMDWAVVDSLPYLYFLQYKVYSQLQRPDDKLMALINLFPYDLF